MHYNAQMDDSDMGLDYTIQDVQYEVTKNTF